METHLPDTMTNQRRFAVFGHPVAHSLSPAMHNANFQALGLEATYEKRDIDSVAAFYAALADYRQGGVNCTIPLKRIAFENCDHLDSTAQRFGVVNTIRFNPDATTTGFNTDGTGFLQSLQEDRHTTPSGQSLFIFGCGGAGRAIAITCADAGATRIVLANRSTTRMETLAAELTLLTPQVTIETTLSTPAAWAQACRTCDLIVQCSSVGLHPRDTSPLPQNAFHSRQKLYDLIYNTPATPTMIAARAAGAQTANGLGMLIHQGAASFTIWTGLQANVSAMRHALMASLPHS
jgi:shikimate dehydrogenase